MDFDGIRERATCQLQDSCQARLQRRGAYIGEVLQTLQRNFRRHQSNAIQETLKEARHMLGCYQVLLSEVSQELEMLGLELFGQGLCKLFYQMIEIVRWLASLLAEGITVGADASRAPQALQLVVVKQTPTATARQEKEKKVEDNFAQLERARFEESNQEALNQRAAATDGELDFELAVRLSIMQERLKNRQAVAAIEKSNATAILKEAIVVLENQRKGIAMLPRPDDPSLLPKMRDLEDMLMSEITQKHEMHNSCSCMLQTLSQKLKRLLKLRADSIRPATCDGECQTNEVAQPKLQQHQRANEAVKHEIQRKRLAKQLQECRQQLNSKGSDLSQAMLEKEQQLKLIQQLQNELVVKQQSFVDISFKLHSMVAPSQKTLAMEQTHSTVVIDEIDEDVEEPPLRLVFKKSTQKSTKQLKKNLLMQPQFKLELDSNVLSERIIPLAETTFTSQNWMSRSRPIPYIVEPAKVEYVCERCKNEPAPVRYQTQLKETESVSVQTAPPRQSQHKPASSSASRKVLRSSLVAARSTQSQIVDQSQNVIGSSPPLRPISVNRTTTSSLFMNRQPPYKEAPLLEITQPAKERAFSRVREEYSVSESDWLRFDKHDLDLFRSEEHALNFESLSIAKSTRTELRKSKLMQPQQSTPSLMRMLDSLEVIGMNLQQDESQNAQPGGAQTKGQLVFRLYQFLRRRPDKLKKVQTFLRYPFSSVQYGESSEWRSQIEQDTEITFQELTRLIERLSRLHIRCLHHNRHFCDHFTVFFKKIGFCA